MKKLKKKLYVIFQNHNAVDIFFLIDLIKIKKYNKKI